MKKVFSVMLIFLMGLFLYSCDKKENFSITVNGCENYNVDIENKNVDITVNETFAQFDLNNIVIPDGFTVTFYEGETTEKVIEGNIVNLNYGTNNFLMEIVSKELTDYKLDFKICINRLVGLIDHIETDSWKSVYALNEAFADNNTIRVVYKDGHTDTVNITAEMVSGFDTTTVGERKATITYKEFTVEVFYNVKKSITSVEIATSKTNYFINDKFEPIILLVKFDDNTTENVTISEDMLPEFSTLLACTKTIKFKYKEYELEYTYTVVDIKLEDIKYNDLKQQFIVNDKFVEGKISVKFNNKETYEDVLVTEKNVSGFDTTKPGSFEAKISYNGFTIKYPYTVYENLVEKINKINLKQEYFIGEDIAEGTLNVTYTDGTTKDINITFDMISGFDTTTAGVKELTFKVGNTTSKYSYTVKANVVEKINKINLETKYFVGDDLARGTINVTYTDGTTKDIDITIDMISGFDTTTAGEKVLTFKVDNATLEYNITVEELVVVEILSVDLQNVYIVNDLLANGKIKVMYNSGAIKDLDITQDMYTGFDTKTAGFKSLTFTINAAKFNFEYIVKDGVTSLEVYGKNQFYLNDPLSDLVLYVTFTDSNSHHITITSDMVSGFDTSVVGDKKELTVTYLGKTAKFTYSVIKPSITSLETVTFEDFYRVNQELGRVVLKATYESGKVCDLIVTPEMVTGFDTTSIGPKELTITIDGVKLVLKYTVYDKLKEVNVFSYDHTVVVGSTFNTGVLELIYDSGYVKHVELTKEMVSGFDTTTSGRKQLTVTYEGVTKTFELTVTETALDLPKPEVLDEKLLLKVAKRVLACTYGGSPLTIEQIDAISDETAHISVIYEYFEKAFTAANISNEQLTKLIAMFDRCKLNALFAPMFDPNHSGGIISILMEKENFDKYINVLVEAKQIFSKAQITAFFNAILANANFNSMIDALEDELMRFKGTAREPEIKAELDRITGLKTSFDHRTEILALVNVGYDIVDVLALTTHKEFVTILSLFMVRSPLELTDQQLFNVIEVVRTILGRFIDMGYSNYFKVVFENIISLFFGQIPSDGIQMFKVYSVILDNVRLINNMLNRITVDTIKHVRFLLSYDFMNITADEDKELFTSFKEALYVVDPLLDELRDNVEFNKEVVSLITNMTCIDYLSISVIFDKVLLLGTLDSNTVKYKDFYDIIYLIMTTQIRPGYTIKFHDYHHIGSNYCDGGVLFKKGITSDEACGLMTKYDDLHVQDYMGNITYFTGINVFLSDVNTVGFHIGYIEYNYTRLYFNYYIYESLEDFNLTITNDKICLYTNDSKVYREYTYNNNNNNNLYLPNGVFTYDYYITLTTKVNDEVNPDLISNLDVDLTNIQVNDDSRYYFKGYGFEINIGVSELINKYGLDTTIHTLQYVNYTHSDNKVYKLPVIYLAKNTSPEYYNVKISDLEYDIALKYSDVTNNVDKSKFIIKRDDKYDTPIITESEFKTLISKYFTKPIELYYDSKSIYTIYDGFKIVLENVSHNWVKEQDSYTGVNTLNEVTNDYLIKNAKLYVYDYNKKEDIKLDNVKLFDYMKALGSTVYRKSYDFDYRYYLGDLELGRFYIYDKANITIAIYDSLNSGKYPGKPITSNVKLTDKEIINKLLLQQRYAQYTTSKAIEYTGQDYIDKYYDLKYTSIGLYIQNENTEIIDGNLWIVRDYIFEYNNEYGNSKRFYFNYRELAEVKGKVDTIEIPDTVSEYGYENYIRNNLQLFYGDELNYLGNQKDKVSVKIDNVSMTVTFDIIGNNVVTVPYKVVKKDLDIQCIIDSSYGGKFVSELEKHIISRINEYFNINGNTTNPRITILKEIGGYHSCTAIVRIEFSPEYSFIIHFRACLR